MSHMRMPLTSLLIKPAGPDCNLNCGYCFYLSKSEMFSQTPHHRMKENILKETMQQALAQCEKGISLSWQGGEPTLSGLDFFRKAIELQKSAGHGKAVSNAFQTNGVLLNRKWANFFKKYNFLIGLSIDGPRHVHDRYRRYPKGAGSWEKVRANAQMLLSQQVSVNALTCLSDYAVRYPQEIYQFNKSMGLIYMQFIPIVEWDKKNSSAVAGFSVTAQKYGEFLCRIFDLWLSDFQNGRPTTSVRLFESLFFKTLGQPSPQCTFQEQCGRYLVVEHNGDVYPCDFYVESRWKLGNVKDGRLIDMLNSEKQAAFRKMKKEVPAKCGHCDFEAYCHGGCTKDRVFGQKPGQLNYFCDAYTRFFEYALPVLKDLSRKWQPPA